MDTFHWVFSDAPLSPDKTMKKAKLYYTAPPYPCFVELKNKAIEIWRTYDDEFGYATDKVSRIKDILNLGDNFMYMVAMFDYENQRKLARMLSKETRQEIRNRMIDGGCPISLIPF